MYILTELYYDKGEIISPEHVKCASDNFIDILKNMAQHNFVGIICKCNNERMVTIKMDFLKNYYEKSSDYELFFHLINEYIRLKEINVNRLFRYLNENELLSDSVLLKYFYSIDNYIRLGKSDYLNVIKISSKYIKNFYTVGKFCKILVEDSDFTQDDIDIFLNVNEFLKNCKYNNDSLLYYYEIMKLQSNKKYTKIIFDRLTYKGKVKFINRYGNVYDVLKYINSDTKKSKLNDILNFS